MAAGVTQQGGRGSAANRSASSQHTLPQQLQQQQAQSAALLLAQQQPTFGIIKGAPVVPPFGENERITQAVIIADSFDERFPPLTETTPRCLMPLCNLPLIEYTFELLSTAGIKEALIYCNSHSQKIEKYIASSKWARPNSPIKISVRRIHAKSVGDVLRAVDDGGSILGDFVLMSADVVANISLRELIDAHFIRKRADKTLMMTMGLREANSAHSTRGYGEDTLAVIDVSSGQCLQYEQRPHWPPQKRFSVNAEEVFRGRGAVQVRSDLIDCRIDICTIKVPSLFTENFDWQDLRTDFMPGVLGSDLIEETIYCHVMAEGYAARVRGTQTYDAISRDVIARRTFPIVPDSNFAPGDTYRHTRGNVYTEQNVVMLRHSHVGPNVIIGADSVIGDNTFITNSVIGKRCTIGNGVRIDGAYLWDDAVVEDGCVIKQSIVGAGARILKGSTIKRGCLIAASVVIGPDVKLPRFTKVGRYPRVIRDSDDEDFDDEDNGEFGEDAGIFAPAKYSRTSSNIGSGTQSFENSDYSDDDDDDDDGKFDSNQAAASALGIRNLSIKDDQDGDDEDDGEDEDTEDHSDADSDHDPSIGTKGIGFIWNMDLTHGSDDEDETPRQLMARQYNASLYDIGVDIARLKLSAKTHFASADSDNEDDDEDEDDGETQMDDLWDASSESDVNEELAEELSSSDLDEDDLDEANLQNMLAQSAEAARRDAEQQTTTFIREINEFIDAQLAIPVPHVEFLATELNSYRMSVNGDQELLRRTVAERIVDLVDTASPSASAKKVIETWSLLIKRMTVEVRAEIQVLFALQKHLAKSADPAKWKVLPHVVKHLYMEDTLSADAILEWFERSLQLKAAGKETENETTVRNLVKPLVEFIQEESDDEDDDDEDDESEEEDSDEDSE
ncbi:nucleotide-diphospho-sugar transferase [Ramicandelaber brevisporus]|nr:nucleotide-diphospho-sugar transferase [Ramicandelaber brevisporus]